MSIAERPRRYFKTKTVVVCKGRVLLESIDKKMWSPVVCKMREDEVPDEAAARDVKKLTGLDVKLFHPHPTAFINQLHPETQPVQINLDEENPARNIEFVYYASAPASEIDSNHPERIFKWFTQQEMESTSVPEPERDLCTGALRVVA